MKIKSPLIPVAALFIFLVVIVFSIRWISGEDSWICDNGDWVKHGVPLAAKPTSFCPTSSPASKETMTLNVYFPNSKKKPGKL